MSKDVLETIIATVVTAIVRSLLFGFYVYCGWNYGLRPVSGVPEITFAQSLWLTCLAWGILRPVIPTKFIAREE